jgi:acetoin utilization protein AcuC
VTGIVPGMSGGAGPLLVYGPWSDRYDFGGWHPLTPLRFGPGIDLLTAVGAEPGLAPEPASDEDLALCHARSYVDIVRRIAADPDRPGEAGIGPGDCPAFPDMHRASAAVAGGSLRAVEAILRGEIDHAFHPGGGLHHAMAGRASGFCIYNDVALAIARARAAGLRVLYIDLDAHHGDGVQALHADDPGVLTFSIHESGHYLFPGTGFADELGRGVAAGSSVNVPLEPWTGERPWLTAVRSIVPELAASFGADLVVSQHGSDSHAWDPLAHLCVTTTAMGEAARLVDRLAHRWSGGRWLATGGGGYETYRVVPRAWTLTWLAGAHRETPDELPPAWRTRWQAAAERHGTAPLPPRFDDPPNAGLPIDDGQHLAELRSAEQARTIRRAVVPRLVREAADRGWLDPGSPSDSPPTRRSADRATASEPAIVDRIDVESVSRLTVAPRVVSPADPHAVAAILGAGIVDGGLAVTAAIADDVLIGLVASTRDEVDEAARAVVAIGVSPAHRRSGLAGRMLARHLATHDAVSRWEAEVTVADRDWIEPLDRADRSSIANRLLGGAGFRPIRTDEIRSVDPGALRFRRT